MNEMLWHTLDAAQTLKELEASESGLDTGEVRNRLKKFGRNVLPCRRRLTLLEIVLRQFLSPLIYVLIAAGVLSVVLGKYEDAIFIGVILFVNALIGAVQESKAETSAEALQQMIKVRATIRRDGRTSDVDAEELVPGDLVYLESGDMVPADLRLLKTNGFKVEEAILTGESVAVEKVSGRIFEASVGVGDRLNMAFAGTLVSSGRAQGVVVNTGLKTEIGQISEQLTEVGASKAPLVTRMERFARMVSIVVLVACSVLGVLGYIGGIAIEEIFFFAVAIAVSAIPEGLPIAMTVALSIGTSRMAKRNVIVRKLTAVEGLGSCTMIATDKTGTLTVDQQTVKKVVLPDGRIFDFSGSGYNGEGKVTDENGMPVSYETHDELAEFIRASVICNEAHLERDGEEWLHQGDAVDAALLAMAYKAGTSPAAIRREANIKSTIPFESSRKFAASYFTQNDMLCIAVKGAAEVIIDSANNIDESSIYRQVNKLAEQGFRVLAVAGSEVNSITEDTLPPLRFFGLVALIDPPRLEVKESIDLCHNAGIEVCMITGDHPGTALAIAKELHIADSTDQLVTGIELESLTDGYDVALSEIIKNKRVFARVSPTQKQQIVAAFQQYGHFVAVTGDGVNDAPALKTGNIGVAMGYGTDVAKGVASIILTDNNFTSIAAGVEEGRITYANLRKIIYFLISTGAAEILMITLALLAGTPLPFLPLQILWLNLVTNGIQDKGLAFEKGEKNVMLQGPRDPLERVFNRQMIRQTLIASTVMALLTFGLWYHLINHLLWDVAEARNTILLLMVLLQNFHLFNTRSEHASVFSIPLKSNLWLIGGVVLAQVVHIISMQIPLMQNLLGIQPVSYVNWLKLLGTAALIVVALEVYKWFSRKARA